MPTPGPGRSPQSVQIFGFRDCAETRKAQRFFSERRAAIHFIDLEQRPASPGELRRFQEEFGSGALINRDAKRFRDLGLRVSGDSPERLVQRALTEPRLLRTPLVRCGSEVAIGYQPEEWRRWAENR
jgi:arsenate reductase (glutaredoxin)